MQHVSQDDRASQSESAPEGIEVAVTSWPKRSVETSGSRATEAFEARASELLRPPEDAAAEKAATEKGKQPVGLIETLVANGICADAKGGCVAEGAEPNEDEVENQHPTQWAVRLEHEADYNEADAFNDFLKGVIQEDELRETLEYYRESRMRFGAGPSKIREIDISEARLALARCRREAKGGVAETTKKAKNHRSHPRRKG